MALTAFVDSRLAEMRPAPLGRAPLAKGEVHRNFVGGRFIAGSGETFATLNPATGDTLAEVEIAGPETVAAAVAAARAVAAGARWAAMTGTERGRVLKRAADLLRAANTELAELETRDTGKPIQETLAVDVQSGADCLEYYGGIAATLAGEHIDLEPGGFRLYAPRTPWCRCRNRRLELSDPDRLLEIGPGVGLR